MLRIFFNANDQKEFNAIVSLLIAIGEESKKIDDKLKQSILIKVNWQEIAKIGDKISHHYRGIDVDILWSVIHHNFVPLKQALLEMLRLIKPDEALLQTLLAEANYGKYLRYLRKINEND